MAASVEVGLKFIAFVPCNALYDNTNFYTNMCPMHAGHMMFIFDLQIDARAGNLGTRRENRWFKSVEHPQQWLLLKDNQTLNPMIRVCKQSSFL
ncbi:hypothetical protein R3I94_016583 [Phoxinus phoxinus]